jgi:hypothetical protein
MAKAELHMSIVIKTGADQGRKPQVRYMSGARSKRIYIQPPVLEHVSNFALIAASLFKGLGLVEAFARLAANKDIVGVWGLWRKCSMNDVGVLQMLHGEKVVFLDWVTLVYRYGYR